MKKTLVAIALTITMLVGTSTMAFAGTTTATTNTTTTATATTLDLSATAVYDKIIAMKADYPQGMAWTNANKYKSTAMNMSGLGCAAFAFIVSDKVFGDLPVVKTTDTSNMRVGDMVRINNDTHNVVILTIDSKNVTVVEGNFNSAINWGRSFDLATFKSKITYVETRYPADGTTSVAVTTPAVKAPVVATTPAPVVKAPVTTQTAPVVKTTPAPTTTAPVATGTLVVTTKTTANSKSFEARLDGKMIESRATAVTKSYATTDHNQAKYGVVITSDANSTAYTVSYAGKTVTVNAGESVTLTK